MCHMTADTLCELHDMASRLAMRREWFQIPPKASFPHYDIPEQRRAMAIEYGAIEVDARTSLYFAARLGVEWALKEDDQVLLNRYNRTIQRAANHVPPSLIAQNF